jgi:A/G-specific adenine glycosylase
VEAASLSGPIKLPAGAPLRLAGNCSAVNQSLMELGATVCTPVNPRCTVCPLKQHCVALRADRIAFFPSVAKRPAPTLRRFVAFVIRHNGRVLVRQRPAGVVNAHLWEFPNVEIPLNGGDSASVAAGLLGWELADVRPLGLIRHSITRYRIALEGYEARVKGTVPHAAGAGKPPSHLRTLPFTAAHQKLAKLAGM